MALQTSGAISLNDIHLEAGGGNATQAKMNDSDIRGLIGKSAQTQSSFSEFYGAANVIYSITGNISSSSQTISSNRHPQYGGGVDPFYSFATWVTWRSNPTSQSGSLFQELYVARDLLNGDEFFVLEYASGQAGPNMGGGTTMTVTDGSTTVSKPFYGGGTGSAGGNSSIDFVYVRSDSRKAVASTKESNQTFAPFIGKSVTVTIT